MESYPFILITKTTITPPMEFGLACLCEHYVRKGCSFNRIVLDCKADLADQEYERRVVGQTITLFSSTDAGFLYALLDLRADDAQSDCIRKPYIKQRGIKYNIPLDARTPSYSDASDIAFHSLQKIWDFSFWEEYLDTMAENKYNLLSLWSLSPFPSLVVAKGFERMSLSDVKCSTLAPKPSMSGDTLYTPDMESKLVTIKKLTIEEKIKFFNRVISYAKDRCIAVYLFTWNIFIFGAESKIYGISSDLENETTKAYLRSAMTSLMESYPALAGFGFTAGERMSGNAKDDVAYLFETYTQAVRTYLNTHPKRRFVLIHRTHWAASSIIEILYRDYPHSFALSFKYTNAHLHSHPEPKFLEQFKNENPSNFKLFLTLRDDDYYLHRWANYDYAKMFISHLPARDIEGFYLGSDGYSWGWETASKHGGGELYIHKHWLKLALFGQLSYDPTLPKKEFVRQFLFHHPSLDEQYFSMLEEASSMLNLVTMLHWHDWDFQWYVEGCCKFIHPPIGKLAFEDIIDFLECPSMPGSNCLSIQASIIQQERPVGMLCAMDIAHELEYHATKVLEYTNPILKSSKEDDDVWEMTMDIHSLGLLGHYYACKIEAAYRLGCAIIGKSGEENLFALLETASSLWEQYAHEMHTCYRPQRFARLCSYIDFRQFTDAAKWESVLAREYLAKAQRGEYVLVE
ncbi:MAG: hypothetical protein M0R06_09900 [Sphaerochaeta sp.]|jgi:hypothetical protein|nr:hypothetical protein [Sphaerochaeta sp.]